MSWRDTLQECTFRGIVCRYRRASTQRGRRLVVHEYPQRDQADVEDMGRRNRKFRMDLFLLDSEQPGTLNQRRDALIAALEQRGAGTLVHPHYGALTVYVERVRESYSTREGGVVRLSVTFVEAAAERAPNVTVDTARVVRERADDLEDASRNVFTEMYDTAGMAASYIDDVTSAVTQHLGEIERYSEHFSRDISDAISSPFDLAGVLFDGVHHILANVQSITDVSFAVPGLFGDSSTRRAMSDYRGLFNAGGDAPKVPDTTEQRRKQKRNQDGCFDLVQRAAVSGAAKASSQTDYTTSDAACADRDAILDAIDDQQRKSAPLGGPIDDDVYIALSDLARSVEDDLTHRAARLPALTIYTPRETVPALVVAHRVYGDAAHADALVRRNHVVNPGFVPGGEQLEVLSV